MGTYDWQLPSGATGDWGDPANWAMAASGENVIQGVTCPPSDNDTASFSGSTPTTVTGSATFDTIALHGANLTLDGGFIGGSTGSSITDDGLTSGASSLLIASFGDLEAEVVDLTTSSVTLQGVLVARSGQVLAVTVDGSEAYLCSLGDLAVSQLQVCNGGTVLGNITLLDGGVLSVDSMSNVAQGTLTTSGSATIRFPSALATGTLPYLFDDVECAAGTALTFDGQNGAATSQLNGAIDGGGDVKFVNGSFALGGSNTTTGVTTVLASHVIVGAVSNLGLGIVLLNASTLATLGQIVVNQLRLVNGSRASGDITIVDGGAIDVDGGSSLELTHIQADGQAAVRFAANQGTLQLKSLVADLTVVAGGKLDLDCQGLSVPLHVVGDVSGEGELQLSNGAFVIDGNGSQSGGTNIVNAEVSVSAVGSLGPGPLTLDNAGLTFTDAITSSSALEVDVFGGSDTIVAGGFGLVVSDQSTNGLTFVGGTAASLVFGGSGVLDATGGSGGDALFGGSSGDDILRGGAGAGYLITGPNGGMAETSGINQQIFVGNGGDSIFDGSQCAGDQGFFNSNSGQTLDRAGSGLNLVVSGDGETSIVGSSGGLGVFVVGAGKLDINLTFGNHELVEVIGFQAGLDHLDLSGFTSEEPATAVTSAVVWGGTTILQLSDSTTVALFDYVSLSVSDFT